MATIARLGYAVALMALLALGVVLAARAIRGRHDSLPAVEKPAEIAALACEPAVEKARALTKSPALDRARLAYLWVLRHCRDSPSLPAAMLEAGSLFGHLQQQPREAKLVYEDFLRRFPSSPEAGDATYHLARIEIDAGDYAAAVVHLTALAQRHPGSPHEESAKFLAARAAEMLAADRRSRRTVVGQVTQLVPNNLVSFISFFLALLAAVGPAVIQAVHKARSEPPGVSPWRWLVPSIVIGLTLLNYLLNNLDSARRNSMLMEKLDKLGASGVTSQQPR